MYVLYIHISQPNGRSHICEVQIHHKNILLAKHAVHEDYEAVRVTGDQSQEAEYPSTYIAEYFNRVYIDTLPYTHFKCR